jgi:hypothetical protein
MPKSFVSNNYMFYHCPINQTRREFQCKKDFDKYLNRHHKTCKCIYIPSNEEDYGNTKKTDLITIK